MANNAQLFNAALAGFLQGAMQANPISSTAADYDDICENAEAFATKVDAGIAADGTIVTPLVAAGQRKVTLLQSLCAGVIAGRVPLSSTANDYTAMAAAIVAAYTQGVTKLV